MSYFDIKDFWKIIKIVRKSFIKKKTPSLNCYKFSFLRDTDITEITNSLTDMLKVNVSLDIFDDVTDEVLESAGKMLFYLGSCPGPVLLSWKEFYKEMFESFDIQTIILTLNRILKISDGNIYDITASLITKVRSFIGNPSGMILLI